MSVQRENRWSKLVITLMAELFGSVLRGLLYFAFR